MSFTKITSKLMIVPFTSEYLKNPYEDDDDEIIRNAKKEFEKNPLRFRIKKLYETKSIVGYFSNNELVMLDSKIYNSQTYTNVITQFITNKLEKGAYVIFEGTEDYSNITHIMSNLIKQDVFEIDSISTYHYKSDSSSMYISYVDS